MTDDSSPWHTEGMSTQRVGELIDIIAPQMSPVPPGERTGTVARGEDWRLRKEVVCLTDGMVLGRDEVITRNHSGHVVIVADLFIPDVGAPQGVLD